jgi:drug/metabolite transporter (DMT)-like permease
VHQGYKWASSIGTALSTTLIASLFALTAAVAWGGGDFAGGMNARRIGALHALLLSFLFGFAALLLLAVGFNDPVPPLRDWLVGAIAGLCGTAGFLFLLRGFAIGRMSIVAPLSAVLAAALPVIFTAFFEGLPRIIQLVGFAVAFVSIWLLSSEEGGEKRPAGIGLALLAGLGFGLFFILLDQLGDISTFWPLVAGRIATIGVMAGYVLLARQPFVPEGAPWKLLALAGIADVGGNFFFLQAVQTGRLDVASVLVSLYPAVTAGLALLIAKEQITRAQMIGAVAAVIAIALIAA